MIIMTKYIAFIIKASVYILKQRYCLQTLRILLGVIRFTYFNSSINRAIDHEAEWIVM